MSAVVYHDLICIASAGEMEQMMMMAATPLHYHLITISNVCNQFTVYFFACSLSTFAASTFTCRHILFLLFIQFLQARLYKAAATSILLLGGVC